MIRTNCECRMRIVVRRSVSSFLGVMILLFAVDVSDGQVTRGDQRPVADNSIQSASFSRTAGSQVGSNRKPASFKPKSKAASTAMPITARGERSSKSVSAGNPFGTMLALLCVIGIIVVAYRMLKKNGFGSSGLSSDAVEILGQAVLGHRQSLQIVRLGSRILVLGNSGEGLTTLSEITDPAEVASLEAACRNKRGETNAAAALDSVVDLFAPGRKNRSPRTAARSNLTSTVNTANAAPSKSSANRPVRAGRPVGNAPLEDFHA